MICDCSVSNSCLRFASASRTISCIRRRICPAISLIDFPRWRISYEPPMYTGALKLPASRTPTDFSSSRIGFVILDEI